MGEIGAAIEFTKDDLKSLESRLAQSNLSKKDVSTILGVFQLVVSLREAMTRQKLGLLRLVRSMFGLKTEARKLRPKNSIKNQDEKKIGNHKGRKGRDDYPGAEKLEVPHPKLHNGDSCPECLKGKIREAQSGVEYDWSGQSPLTLKIFLLQRFICHSCKSTFTSPSPVRETAKTVDDSQDETKVTRCNRNAAANAMVASLRYTYGIPCYRLAKIQHKMGVGLPESTQYAMISQVYDAALPVYMDLMREAAQASLFFADDTAIKILDWLRGKGPPSKSTKKPRKQATTSAIVAKNQDGREIVLYLTGDKAAGRHMDEILKHRETDRGSAIYMCDALSSNRLAEAHPVILVHCLDHGRRQFYDLCELFPKAANYVLDELALVYRADRDSKILNHDPDERLVHHQIHSKPVMERLGRWMEDQLIQQNIERNGLLAKAIEYFLKRWTEFTEFLHTPGVPLSNAECERAIKQIIIHRKNSLFYRSIRGAQVGDAIQSLVATCQKMGVNSFEYLTWLQENKSAVKKSPNEFVPWCFSK